MISFLLAALLGSGATAALLWPLGPFVALMAAPLGGSLLALCTAVVLVLCREQDHAAPVGDLPSVPAEVL